MIDIETYEAADEFTVELVNADDKPMLDADGRRAAIVVFGPGSKAYAAAQAARSQRMITRLAAKGKAAHMTPEQQVADNADFLAACTKAFLNFRYRGSDSDFRGLYGNTKLGFIADQVGKAIGDWANFSSGSATS